MPTRDYILLYNNVGRICEGSENTAALKIAVFDNPSVT